MSLIWFLILLFVIGAAGWFVITKFNLGQTALTVFGCVLLLALVLYLIGGFGPGIPAGPFGGRVP